MSSYRTDPAVTAEHLIETIRPPSDSAISISTYFRPGQPLALKVFIAPQYKYLESRVPDHLDGYEILHEVAKLANAN